MKHRKLLSFAATATLALLLASCGAKKSVPSPPSEQVPVSPERPQMTSSWSRPTGDSIREEMRAVWLTTVYGLDWPRDKADTPSGVRRQKESLLRILDRLKADGYNTVFLQLRHSGAVIYPSDYEPLSTRFAGEGFYGDYDPVTFALEACHERGLSLHAWLVTYPLVSSKRSPHPLLRDHPDWVIAHKGSHHLDPGHPGVRSYIAHLATDLARRYPKLDGVHFDYFRYPEAAEQFADGRSFSRYGADFASKADWRRANLTAQLREVRDSLASIHSLLQVSVAPLGKYRKIADLGRPHGWTAYESVYQDPQEWGKEGLVDFIVPMMYYKDQLYTPFLQQWKDEVAPYVPVIPGLAPYRVQETGWPASTMQEQISEEREVGLSGVSFFRETHTGDAYPAIRRIIQQAFRPTALPLSLARGRLLPAVAPDSLRISPISSREFLLSWSVPTTASAPEVTFRLWAITTDTAGKRQASRLAEGLKTTQCRLLLEDFQEAQRIEFGVEAVNRFGVSTPCTAGYTISLPVLREVLQSKK